jgi:hypothetical protein
MLPTITERSFSGVSLFSTLSCLEWSLTRTSIKKLKMAKVDVIPMVGMPTVLSFLEVAMTKMSTELPHLQLMCLALDNASNYHRKELQRCIPVLNTILLGVELDKNIHKETKDGKGGCDSHGGNADGPKLSRSGHDKDVN